MKVHIEMEYNIRTQWPEKALELATIYASADIHEVWISKKCPKGVKVKIIR